MAKRWEITLTRALFIQYPISALAAYNYVPWTEQNFGTTVYKIRSCLRLSKLHNLSAHLHKCKQHRVPSF